MPQTIVASDRVTGRRGLIIEVHPELTEPSEEELTSFCKRLYDRNVYVGLVVTPQVTAVVRDLLTEVSFSGNRYEIHRLSTPELMQQARITPRSGQAFHAQVRVWLNAINSSWYSVLPKDALTAMMPEVIGSLVEADLETLDDVLESSNAA
jgi:hypothetical protein